MSKTEHWKVTMTGNGDTLGEVESSATEPSEVADIISRGIVSHLKNGKFDQTTGRVFVDALSGLCFDLIATHLEEIPE